MTSQCFESFQQCGQSKIAGHLIALNLVLRHWSGVLVFITDENIKIKKISQNKESVIDTITGSR